MAITFSTTGAMIDAQKIEEFERRNGLNLPEDYRRFLLRYNGGRPQPDCSRIPQVGQSVLVDFLFGIAEREELDLQACLDEFGDELPPGFLIIGQDAGAALFILGTEASDRGVYFWDHQHRYPGSSEENGNTFLLADSFTAWIHSLHELSRGK